MNKKDKDKLLILGIVVVYILVTVAFIVGTQYVPWRLLIILILIAEYFIVQPRVCALYYKANNVKCSFTRFIPFWNEIMMFKHKRAIMALISYVVLAILVALLFLPGEIVGNVFGEHFMLNYGYIMIRIIAVALVVNSIIVGLGFVEVNSKLKFMHNELTGGGKIYSTNVVYNIFLFIPILRTIALVNMMSTLVKLVCLNDYHNGVQKKEDLVEEA